MTYCIPSFFIEFYARPNPAASHEEILEYSLFSGPRPTLYPLELISKYKTHISSIIYE